MLNVPQIFDDFHFLRPWFFILIPFAFFIIWKLSIALAGTNPWQELISPHLQRFMIGAADPKVSNNRRHQQVIGSILLLMILALLGPTLWKKSMVGVETKPQVMILVDQSLSMLVEDVKPSRYKRAAFLVKDIVAQLPTADIGLMVYAGSEHPLVPLTATHEIVTTAIDTISPLLMPAKGSNAATAYSATLASVMGQPKSTIIWITDEIRTSEHSQIKKQLQQAKIKTIFIGVGTEESGPIELPNGKLLRDKQGQLVVPTYNLDAMKALATEGNAAFFDHSDLYGDQLRQVTSSIESTGEGNSAEESLYDQWDDIGPWLLLPAALLFASIFRKGFLFILIIAVQPLTTSELHAWNSERNAYSDYQNQDYEAALLSQDPLIQGAAHYRLKNYAAAAQAWTLEASQAPAGSERAQQAYYNLGNALVQDGNVKAAKGAYLKVLEWNTEHENAKKNLDLLNQLEEPEQEQQQEDQDSDQPPEESDGDGEKSDSGQPDQDTQGQQSESDKGSQSEEQEPGNSKDESAKELDTAAKQALDEALKEFAPPDTAPEQETEDDTQEPPEPDPAINEKTNPKAEDEIKEPEQRVNPTIDNIDLQPGGVLENKMLRQYQIQQRQNQRQRRTRGEDDVIW